MITLDASVALSWMFDDERDDFAKKSLARVGAETALAPVIFPAEIANALRYAIKMRRISETDARDALKHVQDLPIKIISNGFDFALQLSLAQQYNLSIYDAMYLGLARKHRIPLLTRDQSLQTAAQSENLAP